MYENSHVSASRAIQAIVQVFGNQMPWQPSPVVHHRKALSVQQNIFVGVEADVGKAVLEHPSISAYCQPAEVRPALQSLGEQSRHRFAFSR